MPVRSVLGKPHVRLLLTFILYAYDRPVDDCYRRILG